MGFFRDIDYKHKINDEDFAIITQQDDTVRLVAEKSAEQEMKTRLRQRFDVDNIFRSINSFTISDRYNEFDRIEWIEDAWVSGQSYLAGEFVSHKGKIYLLISDNNSTEPGTNDAIWSEQADYRQLYVRVGTDTAAGHLPTETAFWTLGDDRDEEVKNYFIDITLFKMIPSQSPRVVPEHRMNLYKIAVAWLKDVASGKITTVLPLLLDANGDDQGDNITYGSNTKQCHDY